MRWRICVAIIVWSAAVGSVAPAQTDDDSLTVYQTQYYVMHTDLPPQQEREAAIRMSRMAEEYHNRTRDFSGDIRQRMPFYLFKDEDEYLAAGGLPGSQGLFTGDRLMAFAGPHVGATTWHVIQHEGFHQFAFYVIGGDIPVWMNEGLAEYFGYAIFTGDGYVSGAIPPNQLRAIRVEMGRPPDEGGFRPVSELMQMSHAEWNSALLYTNYDEAWSMVQFLAHGDDGKYQRPFTAMMLEMNKGRNWEDAWQDEFGGIAGFEQRWRQYWQNLPNNPTDNKYAEATVATLTSLLARCNESKQTFPNFATFAAALSTQTLNIPDQDWLPPSLMTTASAWLRQRRKLGGKFSLLVPPEGIFPTQVACVLLDGTRLVGSYTMTPDGRVAHVNVAITPPAKP